MKDVQRKPLTIYIFNTSTCYQTKPILNLYVHVHAFINQSDKIKKHIDKIIHVEVCYGTYF